MEGTDTEGCNNTGRDAMQHELRRLEYQTICDGYHRIADFRAKLLALLPLASGTGVGLLINAEPKSGGLSYLWAIGLFGFLATLGLYFYEARGVDRCKKLIERGKELEADLKFRGGLFRDRPDPRFGFIGSETAGYVIYGASALAWLLVFVVGLRRVWFA
jgi:uncharacterized protein (DUF58 family)